MDNPYEDLGNKTPTSDLLEWYWRLNSIPGIQVRITGAMASESYRRSGWNLLAWSRDREGTYHYLFMRTVRTHI